MYISIYSGSLFTDDDECSDPIVENGGCSHTCNNVYGDYYCSCPAGYVLDERGLNCEPGKSMSISSNLLMTQSTQYPPQSTQYPPQSTQPPHASVYSASACLSPLNLHMPQSTQPLHASVHSASTCLSPLSLHMLQSTQPPHASVLSASTCLSLLNLHMPQSTQPPHASV